MPEVVGKGKTRVSDMPEVVGREKTRVSDMPEVVGKGKTRVSDMPEVVGKEKTRVSDMTEVVGREETEVSALHLADKPNGGDLIHKWARIIQKKWTQIMVALIDAVAGDCYMQAQPVPLVAEACRRYYDGGAFTCRLGKTMPERGAVSRPHDITDLVKISA